MFESIISFFKKLGKQNQEVSASSSKSVAKERLQLVLMQDRANVSADFLDLMKREIIEVIKKYIDVDENAIDVRLNNRTNEDGTIGAPFLYADIPVVNIKEDDNKVKEAVKENNSDKKEENKEDNNKIEEVEKLLKETKEEAVEKNPDIKVEDNNNEEDNNKIEEEDEKIEEEASEK